MHTDTIAAIATAMSPSGIGIVRISGSQAFSVIEKIFRKKNGKTADTRQSHRIHYGYIQDGEEVLDEVLVMIMKGPHSYTAEDTVEINCHGGVLVMQRILETVLRSVAVIMQIGGDDGVTALPSVQRRFKYINLHAPSGRHPFAQMRRLQPECRPHSLGGRQDATALEIAIGLQIGRRGVQTPRVISGATGTGVPPLGADM